MTNVSEHEPEVGFEASWQQARMWRLGARGRKRICAVFSLDFAADLGKLEHAVQSAASQHEILRTELVGMPGLHAPIQVVRRPGLAEGRQQALRYSARLAGATTRLALAVSPLHADALSLWRLAEDAVRIYFGEDPDSAPAYVDYAASQAELLEARALPPEWTRSWGRLINAKSLELGPETTSLVEAAERELAAGPREVFLLAWLLVHGVAGRGRACSAVGTSGRPGASFARAVGPYASSVPVSLTIDGDAGFADMLGAVRNELASADLAAVAPAFELDHEPFLPLAFEWRQRRETLGPRGARIRCERLSAPPDAFELRLRVETFEGGATAFIDYDTRAHSLDSVAQVGARIHALLAHMARPGTSIAEADLTLPEEKLWLESVARGPQRTRPRTFPELFRTSVERAAEVVAAESGSTQLSYRELEIGARALAQELTERGHAGKPVAIIADHRPELLTMLLGVWFARGVAVPLDPTHPPARLERLLAQAQASAVIAIDAPPAGLAIGTTEFIRLQQLAASAAEGSGRPSSPEPSDPAYILFTSGSTGQPKGVVVPHRALANYLVYAAETYALTAGCGALAHTPAVFDLSFTALLAPLIVGQRVIFVPRERGVQALGWALREGHDFSLLKVTPTHLRLLNEQLSGLDLGGKVRSLVIGGEALDAAVVRPWLALTPRTRVFNEYGPTEATVGCAVHELQADGDPHGPIPIGRPITNTRLEILSARFVPLPPGAIGEVCVSGDALALGYLDESAEGGGAAFERLEPGAGPPTLYRTGDLGWVDPGGVFHFEGRRDTQLKLHGYRIEPAEVEAELRNEAEVQDALAFLEQSANLPARLVARVCLQKGSRLDGDTLRRALVERLPSFLVPAAIEIVPSLPVDSNGKLLRRTHELRAASEAKASIPLLLTDQEALLAELFCEVLQRPEVRLDDNYFALGGDSIRSIQLVARARAAGLSITLEDLFSYPSVRSLAARALREPAAALAPATVPPFSLVSIEDRARLPDGLEDAYPLTSLQLGMILHNELGGARAVYHDVFSYHLRLPAIPEALKEAARALVVRHPALRTCFDLGSYQEPLQLVAVQGAELLTIADLSSLPATDQAREISAWIEQDKRRGFEHEQLPLVRLQVHVRSSETLQLTLSFHHAVIDGWSDVSLLNEFLSHYLYLIDGRGALPEPVRSYTAAHVVLERESLTSAESRAFWENELTDSEPGRLPRLSSATDPESEGYLDVALADLTDQVRALAVEMRCSVKSVLLAAHVRVMAHWLGRNDVLTAVVANGRPVGPDAERSVGLFIHSVPLRVLIDGAASFRELIDAVVAAERRCFPHRRFPLAELVRMRGGAPVAETLFYFTHYHLIEGLRRSARVELLDFIPHEVSSFPLVANFYLHPWTGELGLRLASHTGVLSADRRPALAHAYRRALEEFLLRPDSPVGPVELLPAAEKQRLVEEWNPPVLDASTPRPLALDLDAMFERHAEQPALTFQGRTLSYAELGARARRTARALAALKLEPGARIALWCHRSPELVVGLLGIFLSGHCYVPLDPQAPDARSAFVLGDAEVATLVVDVDSADAARALGGSRALVVVDASAPAPDDRTAAVSHPRPDDPAYVMYTSGSTGAPKGVVVTQANLASFLAAIDRELGPDAGTWLGLTSVTFDISLLELLWTLSRGGRVVLQAEPHSYFSAEHSVPQPRLDAGLFFFAGSDDPSADGYRLLQDAARIADAGDFSAIWTPERHFHEFGGLFPNPSLTSAAIAAITRRIGIRAGSVVLPLHDPIRVAEEWAAVDRLSNGRVAVAFASGWHRDDFVLGKERFEQRREHLDRDIEVVQRLWRGETIERLDLDGIARQVRIHPRPVQAELPMFLSAAGTERTFARAASLGAGVLTHLLGQDLASLARKIRAFRAAGGLGRVVVMLHTFVGERDDDARELARAPFLRYLRSSLGLVRGLLPEIAIDPEALSPADVDELCERAFQRYFDSAGLLGDAARCRDLADRLQAIGVDELACLIDFGIPNAPVLESLPRLEEALHRSRAGANRPDDSIASQITRHGVTHLQCTPTIAAALLRDGATRRALARLKTVILGGEACAESLVNELALATQARIFNFYGPTEATVWATAGRLRAGERVSIGRPLANTRVYVVDAFDQLAPIGVGGELCLSGPGVAAGYQNDSDLTARHFGRDPITGGRLYRTGDRARWLPDGRLELLGRRDEQLKIHGQRVEPAEVETALALHPNVSECVVSASESTLVAYVVALPSTRREELRKHCELRLPLAMVPSRIEFVDAIPRTPGGKADRRALARGARDIPTAPRNKVEREMLEIWEQTLGRTGIGVFDSFFALGGHSLTATMLIARARRKFASELPLAALFNTPTIAGLAAAVSAQGGLTPTSGAPRLARGPAGAPDLLSFTQERMWFLEQIARGSAAYHDAVTLKISGPLERTLMQRSVDALGARHEILRATFHESDGVPRRATAQQVLLMLECDDLAGLSASEQTDRLELACRDLAHQTFDLTNGPLLRTRLFRRAATDHVLHVVVHHLISDGWSLALLVRELFSIYTALAAGRAPKLPELSVGYGDYARWQRESLRGERLGWLVSYWLETLRDARALELPPDFPRPAIEEFRGGVEPVELSAPLIACLASLGAKSDATLFMTLLAGWKALLYHRTGSEDLVIGTDVANRVEPELEALVGPLVNQLVIRTRVTPELSFRELVERVRDACVGAFEHQELPFDRLVERMCPERDLSRHPLYQIAFTLQQHPEIHAHTAGLGVSVLPSDTGIARLDLEVNLARSSDGVHGSVLFSDRLYCRPTIRELVREYAALLTAVADNPDLRLRELSQAVPAEPFAPSPQSVSDHARGPRSTFPELFAQRALQEPDLVAVLENEQRVSYGELYERCVENAEVARRVPEQGIVALLAERSPAFLAALLGVLHSGRCYLPLDPREPPFRLAGILKRSRVRLLLVGDSQKLAAERALALLSEKERPELHPLEFRAKHAKGTPPSADLHALAYVIFTSGSTGQPKGALVEHAGMVNHLHAKIADLELSPSDVVAQTAPQSFDISMWQFLAPLAAGSSLRIYGEEQVQSARFLDLVAADGITVLETVPSLLKIWLEEAPERVPVWRLRWLLSTGEELTPSLCRRWFERYPDVPIVNVYGPTECSDDVTHHVLREAPPANALRIPIGRPITNVRLYVLGPGLRPVPKGAAGELYIGGIAVGRGYLHDEARSADAFVPNPFAPDEGRLYRTGDLVRQLPDGAYDFLERVDDQIKLHGARVELGDIQSALLAHPAVAEAAVLARGESSAKRIAAYIVVDPVYWRHAGADQMELARDARVREWAHIYEDLYRERTEVEDPLLRTAGWTSSFSGDSIPAAEMREWADSTGARILALRPKRVLEIGCGTGMQIHRVAPSAERYVATDVSVRALELVRLDLEQARYARSVELLQRAADDFSELGAASFDTVVMNSVVQYFPDLDYLARVLERACAVVSDGGHVFIGDVRNLRLLETFHVAVQLHQARAAESIGGVRARAQRRLLQDEELVLDPLFFESLPRRVARVTSVDVRLKPGRADNELTRFRYDVILSIGSESGPDAETEIFRGSSFTLDALRASLEKRPELLIVERVKDPRLAAERARAEALLAASGGQSVDELRRALAGTEKASGGAHPSDVEDLAARLGYAVSVRWNKDPVAVDYMFRPHGSRRSLSTRSKAEAAAPLANNPLRAKLSLELVPVLRAWLEQRVPPYMIPSAFTLLDALPIGRHGKLDRNALPPPTETRSDPSCPQVSPRNERERLLAEIWSQVLGLEQVGVFDNFFALGGDSITSIQIVARARRAGLQLTAKQAFQHQTIADLARVAEEISRGGADGDELRGEVPLLPSQARFLAFGQPEAHHWNQAALIETPLPIQLESLKKAVAALVAHHGALRLRFERSAQGWKQTYAAVPPPVEDFVLDFKLNADDEERIAQRIARTADELQRSLDLGRGLLFRIARFDLGAGRPMRLLLIAHHLIVDSASWRILLEDLLSAGAQAESARPIEFPPASISLKKWSETLRAHTIALRASSEPDYWLAERSRQAARLAHDIASDDDVNTVGNSALVVRALDAAGTSSLLAEASRLRLHTEEVLLFVLARVFRARTGGGDVLVELETHGREVPWSDLDVSRTVGWCAISYPKLLRLGHHELPSAQLALLKEDLRGVPAGGAHYGLLRWIEGSKRSPLADLPTPQLAFSYHGAAKSSVDRKAKVRFAAAECGASRSPIALRTHELELDCLVEQDELAMYWTYCSRFHDALTLETLADEFVAELGRAVRDLSGTAQLPLGPSDFSLSVTQDELDAALDEVDL